MQTKTNLMLREDYFSLVSGNEVLFYKGNFEELRDTLPADAKCIMFWYRYTFKEVRFLAKKAYKYGLKISRSICNR